MANEAETAAGPVVEKFATSAGRWLGYFGMGFGAVVAVAGAVENPPHDWKTVLLGLGLAGISWIVLVRPAVALHQNGVLLRNLARDSFVPSSKIERCKTAQTLMIRAGADTFHGLGVSRSARSMMREARGPRRGMLSSLGGMSGGFGTGGPADLGVEQPTKKFASQEVEGPTYQVYVETRIQQAAADAPPDDREPVVSWAAPAVSVLVFSVACFVLLFV